MVGGFACKGKWFCMNACGLCMQVQMVLHEWLVVLHASANGFFMNGSWFCMQGQVVLHEWFVVLHARANDFA